MPSRELKITYVAYVTFLLDSAVLEQFCGGDAVHLEHLHSFDFMYLFLVHLDSTFDY